jgi:hypothetical protein
MKKNLFLVSLLLGVLSANAQIDSLLSMKHTISFLTGNFSFDKSNCKTCYDCNKELMQDSLARLDTNYYKYNVGSRVLGSCRALQQLQDLQKIDKQLQEKIITMANKLKTNYDTSTYSQFISLNKSWYQNLDETIFYHGSISMATRSGFLMEQISFARIMVLSRIEELNAIEKLMSYE